MRVVASLVVLLAMLAVDGAAAKPARIDVLSECAPKTACIWVEVEIANVEKKKIRSLGTQCTDRFIVPVRGRLNGGRVRLYHVGFVGDCMPCATSFAGYFGQSVAKNPIVRTSAGRFEIIDRDITIGAEGDLILIDEMSGQIVARYWANFGGARFYLEDGGVYLASGDGPCFVAPQRAPRALTFAPGHCRDRRGNSYPDVLDYRETSTKVQAQLRSLTQNAEMVRVTRVPGTRHLALQLSDNCYQ